MKIDFDIQFFGGSSTSTKKYPKRDPEPQELQDMQTALFNALYPGIQNYDANAWADAQKRSDANMQRQDSAMDMQNAMLSRQNAILDRNGPLLDMMTGSLGRQDKFLDQLPQYMGKSDSILDEMLGVIRTGDIGSTLTDRMNSEVTRNLNNSLGANLNSLGNRGVLNSSITSQGISRLGQQAANAFNANYLNAFNSVVNGYGGALSGAQGNTNSLLGAVNAAGNATGAIGNAIGAVNSASGAYGNAANTAGNAAEIAGNAANNSFSNASAAITPMYNMWKDWKQIHNGKDDYDYVVTQKSGWF